MKGLRKILSDALAMAMAMAVLARLPAIARRFFPATDLTRSRSGVRSFSSCSKSGWSRAGNFQTTSENRSFMHAWLDVLTNGSFGRGVLA